MIRHVALFRLTDDSAATRAAVIAELRALADKIPDIAHLTVGSELGVNAGNHHIAACVDFANLEAYLAYRDHPAHVTFFEQTMKPVLEHRAAVQFEF